uniref:E3 ubiquitin-protein ligase RNF31 isoform X4 n=1 Tax=Monopterus albus TaxID=43700 RepID=UPI0009B3FC37|nr:E3 ubiquitin-protein ligase RNF31-like isoform X4 [Monopterus albus]
MPRVEAEEERRTLMECQYSYPVETLSDLQKVRSLFSDLRLYVDFYCFPNKEKKRLVYLAGTLPVHYEGSEYNIPVCIWLHETHPVSRPRCYICPSVSMVINPSCPCVDASGNISLAGLTNWTHPPPFHYHLLPPVWAESQSMGEEEGGPSPDPMSRMMGALRLDKVSSTDKLSDSSVQTSQSEAVRSDFSAGSVPAPGLCLDLGTQRLQSEPVAGADHIKMAACLPPDQAAIFLFLMRMEGRSFNPADVMEAVQLNRDFPSALRFLTHSCPICQDQVTFSKIITMTHCSCFLCQTCFKTFFSVAIKERSIDQLVCPQCGKPKIRRQGGMEEFMDYFNLLDTQIRHFLPPQVHELFQRKLRDRALQEMPNFCWCAHCSFGMLHEADLRMDCPSCQKSTCSQCRSPWSPHHQGLSCQQFRVWQQQKQPDHHDTKLLCYNSIGTNATPAECPNCHFIFSLSKGGCLHFTCSQCRHQFCGGCSQTFSLGAACGFSADCGMKGLHAHHPRDCLYHLRDWSVPRLHLLLQCYRVSPWLEPANSDSPDITQTGMCLVLELRDDDSRWEEPCGRPALPEYRGHCQSHYKERLVDLINRCQADPAILFSLAEMTAELQRWNIAVPTRKPDEPEPLYARRLRMTLTNSVPLRKQRSCPLKSNDDL